jgi:hypothetical protein
MDEVFDPLDRAADDARLIAPEPWFSAQDCEALIHHDHDLTALQEIFLSLRGALSVVDPPNTYRVFEIAYPEEWRTRLKEMRG